MLPGASPFSGQYWMPYPLRGRELEVCDYTSEISERYTMEEFLKEVRDAGIETDEHFQTAMHDLTAKKIHRTTARWSYSRLFGMLGKPPGY